MDSSTPAFIPIRTRQARHSENDFMSGADSAVCRYSFPWLDCQTNMFSTGRLVNLVTRQLTMLAVLVTMSDISRLLLKPSKMYVLFLIYLQMAKLELTCVC